MNQTLPGIVIREEQDSDRDEVRQVNEVAFGQIEEADLIDNLRTENAVLLSLVAQLHGDVVGHILFSRMTIETADGSIPAVSLAPLAVVPEYQRLGIGGLLVRAGIEILSGWGEQIVIVLGHRDYYPRFGFSAEKARNLESPFPGDSFMALDLVPGVLQDARGRVRYAAAFGLG